MNTNVLPLGLVFTFLLVGFWNYFSFNVSSVHEILVHQQSFEKEFTPIFDTYIAEGKGHENFSGSDSLNVGYDTDRGLGLHYSILSFYISDTIPIDSRILQATLSLNLDGGERRSPLAVSAKLCDTDIPIDVTWQTYDECAGNLVGNSVQSINDDLERHAWTIKDLVQHWSASRNTQSVNLVLQIDETLSSDHERSFASSETERKPILRIIFEQTPTPTPTSTHTPTPVPPTPTPPIKLQVDTNWQSSSGSPEPDATAVHHGDTVDVTLNASNISSELSSIVITSTIPSGFDLVANSASGEPTISTTDPLQLIWDLDGLMAEQPVAVMREYSIDRQTVELEFEAGAPPDSSRAKTNITFSIKDPPGGDGYCYKWDFGDGKGYHLMGMHTIDYVYQSNSGSPFNISVIVTKQKDLPDDENSQTQIPEYYYAKAETTITIRNRSNGAAAKTYKSDCEIQSGVQDVVITAQLSGGQNDPVSASALIAPSKHIYVPLICQGTCENMTHVQK